MCKNQDNQRQNTDNQRQNQDTQQQSQTKNKWNYRRRSIKTHPFGWSETNHYGMCGQSCPCCRKKNKEVLGSCNICK